MISILENFNKWHTWDRLVMVKKKKKKATIFSTSIGNPCHGVKLDKKKED